MPSRSPTPKIQSVPLALIVPGRHQARRTFSEAALSELAASIRVSGVVQPVVLRTLGKGFELLAGERRWRAAQRAGLQAVPALIRDDLGDREAGVLGLIENLQREALPPMETAHGLARLAEDYRLTHTQVAARIGKSRVYVTNFLRLLQLTRPLQRLVDQGCLSLGHAKVLAGAPATVQNELGLEAAKRGWSVRVLERHYSARIRASAPTLSVSGSFQKMEQALSDHLGNRVSIQYSKENRRGELRITFHTLDEFDGLLDRLGYTDPDK